MLSGNEWLEYGAVKGQLKSLNSNEALAQRTWTMLEAVGKESGVGSALVDLAKKLKEDVAKASLILLAKSVSAGEIDKPRYDVALACINESGAEELSKEKLDEVCRVGLVISKEEIAAAVKAKLDENSAELTERRYRFPALKLLPEVVKQLGFVAPGEVRAELTRQVEALLGPKTEADLAKPVKQKKGDGNASGGGGGAAPSKKGGGQLDPNSRKGDNASKDGAADGVGETLEFPSPSANLTGNAPDIWAEHLKITGGRVITRFPPEPNGYLHVGHAKAMHLDFGFAERAEGGQCLLRYDDTNPEAESHEFIDTIRSSVDWLGHKPSRVTYSSDYFEQLFDFALRLIRTNRAFVCHMTKAEMQRARRAGEPSPYRDRPAAESERLFFDMRKGKFAEGEAMLRLRIDHQHLNHVMRDPVAYRIKYWPHPRTGDKWCIYPSYDFTHCTVDSLEHVTHSLCTLEFDVRRESYYWLLDALSLYKPLVWEFSRLTLVDDWVDPRTNEPAWLATSLSKRRLKRMVETGFARGWDDPRMPTLVGLRRRGFSPDALNQFCDEIGVSRAAQRIPFRRLETSLRLYLDKKATRAFGILHPLAVEIVNFDELKKKRGASGITCEAPLTPHNPELGSRTLLLSSSIFLDRSDFRLEDDKSFYGLAPGDKEIILRYASVLLRCEEVLRDEAGEVSSLRCSARTLEEAMEENAQFKKPKGVLHWLSSDDSVEVECRLYEWLFCSILPKPAEAAGGGAKKGKKKATESKTSSPTDDAAAAAAAAALAADDEEDEEAAAAEAEKKAVDVDPFPCSEEVVHHCRVEKAILKQSLTPGASFQFERVGYFTVDKDSTEALPVFNRSVTLKESKEKAQLKGKAPAAVGKKNKQKKAAATAEEESDASKKHHHHHHHHHHSKK